MLVFYPSLGQSVDTPDLGLSLLQVELRCRKDQFSYGATMVTPPKNLGTFESFLEVVSALRGPEGCPWDKEQTHRTLTPYAIEEAHELAEAIENGDQEELISELGDLLLQVVLHSEIARQEQRFDIHDVIRTIGEKMVRRHPHVFSNIQVTGSQDVLANWSKIKDQEKGSQEAKGKDQDLRFDVPLSLPSLSRSHKIGQKTARLRFDWPDAKAVLEKVDEELEEVKSELKENPIKQAALEHEIGDLLFSVAQLARHAGLEAEQCLRTANTRFEKRFFTMRKQIEASGRSYDDLSATELEAAWSQVKIALAEEEKA
jgi:tetrapyrrole methylase family protein/MazG family protein